MHQLSNDLRLLFPTEEAGEETSCEHVVDVLEEPLRRKVGSLVRDQTVDLLLDVLVCEEEGGSCA